MNKLVFKRFFIKDTVGNYYRIFNVANPTDSRGEFYLKIVFPDIRGIPVITGVHDKDGIVSQFNLEKGVHEFSYHYRSGVSHLKDESGKVDSKRNLPTLHDFPSLHLVRFVIRTLDIFELQINPTITPEDFILPITFDGKARGFEFAISRVSGEWKVTNSQGIDPVYTYKIPLNDPNVYFHISDSVWNRDPIAQGKPLFEIFRYDNPTDNFEFTPKENA